jgi:hypothetical protein
MSAHYINDMWGWNNPIKVKINHTERAGLNL